jgi:hypothetical protein
LLYGGKGKKREKMAGISLRFKRSRDTGLWSVSEPVGRTFGVTDIGNAICSLVSKDSSTDAEGKAVLAAIKNLIDELVRRNDIASLSTIYTDLASARSRQRPVAAGPMYINEDGTMTIAKRRPQEPANCLAKLVRQDRSIFEILTRHDEKLVEELLTRLIENNVDGSSSELIISLIESEDVKDPTIAELVKSILEYSLVQRIIELEQSIAPPGGESKTRYRGEPNYMLIQKALYNSLPALAGYLAYTPYEAYGTILSFAPDDRRTHELEKAFELFSSELYSKLTDPRTRASVGVFGTV